jgi:hypothetical protein
MKPDISNLKEQELIQLLFECFKKIDMVNFESYLDKRYERYEENSNSKVGLLLKLINEITQGDVMNYINNRLKDVREKEPALEKVGREFKSTSIIHEVLKNGMLAYETEFRKMYDIQYVDYDDEDLVTTSQAAKLLGVTERTVSQYKEDGKITPVDSSVRRDLYRVGDLRMFLANK